MSCSKVSEVHATVASSVRAQRGNAFCSANNFNVSWEVRGDPCSSVCPQLFLSLCSRAWLLLAAVSLGCGEEKLQCA